ncbi:MAG: SDR family NAD(P)-dependent oxidoreductase [Alphaproteobacteria bacterium]|nr:MAG: SDR family NAD(P)-dependent oxidoreductase [Alphaproteobacteria bacterium]
MSAGSDRPLAGRLALVTGASRGIGRALALGLARAGAHCILVARTAGALEDVDDIIQQEGGQAATLVPLDLADVAGIDRLGGAIAERWGHLDILIGNAGYLGDLSPVPHIAPKDWECNIAVNLTANWRLIRALDPLLRQSKAGRALFLTSGVAHSQKPYWGAYAASKAALEKLVQIYAAEVAQITSLRVNLLNPGPMRTVMRAAAMPGEDPETLPPPEAIVPLVLELVSPAQKASGHVFSFPEWAAAHGVQTG